MHVTTDLLQQLRAEVSRHTRTDEQFCVARLLANTQVTVDQRKRIVATARDLVAGCRASAEGSSALTQFMLQYNLSNKEGLAIMSLAESLLRIPDTRTSSELIAEKIASGDWHAYKGRSSSRLVNASTAGLMFADDAIQLDPNIPKQTYGVLKALSQRLGASVVRKATRMAIKAVGQQYVLGTTPVEALLRGEMKNTPCTRFSIDMLGEGARTDADAEHYYDAYLLAIRDLGLRQRAETVIDSDGISIKLSALHPRYEFAQKGRVITELLPRLKQLALEAKGFNLGFTIDAEEAHRLELSMDLFEALATDPQLSGWDGLGFALQAYSKRSPWVADWLIELAKHTGHRFMIRLVKGAYWDTEIKYAQQNGYSDYPVYTRKENTDLSYQLISEKLLDAGDAIYPQFATHNATTAAFIIEYAGERPFEFQRLHGMGDLLYEQIYAQLYAHRTRETMRCLRVYAPVGPHENLLPYLVRRLLENGASNSFMHRFLDNDISVEEVVTDVLSEVENNESHQHPSIPLPKELFRSTGQMREDSAGRDLTHPPTVTGILSGINPPRDLDQLCGPIINGHLIVGVLAENGGCSREIILCPADANLNLGSCRATTLKEARDAADSANKAQPEWNALGGIARAEILEVAADKMESQLDELVGLICYEAGRTLQDAVAEVREAVDFLRYYAGQAREKFGEPVIRIGADGQWHKHSFNGCGVFFCISPWNFPLAIFTGQIAAALAAGNSVVAKPASATPLIATKAIKILHSAGVPTSVLHFTPGPGGEIGQQMSRDQRIKGVTFTGSTEVAKQIQKTLVSRDTDVPVFIAETGGLNAMIVDSSALIEQVVDDIIESAFYSAGQRCSSLRVLYLQEEIADNLLKMLIGAMQQLVIGNPWELNTDIGPVIDSSAYKTITAHIKKMKLESTLLHGCDIQPQATERNLISPHLFLLDNISQLGEEIFGPVLHVTRYKKENIEEVIKQINETGFGLTLGIHSRIESFSERIIANTRVGNYYINRSMTGAVVGVNPFGGQGLSGTGPKAGGPHYLHAFAKEMVDASDELHEFQQTNNGKSKPADDENEEIENRRKGPIAAPRVLPERSSAIICGEKFLTLTAEKITEMLGQADKNQLAWDSVGGLQRAKVLNRAASKIEAELPEQLTAARLCRHFAQHARDRFEIPITMPGPTGESNTLSLHGRGVFLCAVADHCSLSCFTTQMIAALAAGNSVIALSNKSCAGISQRLVEVLLNSGVPEKVLHFIPGSMFDELQLVKIIARDLRLSGVAWSGPTAGAIAIQKTLSERDGMIVPMVTAEMADIAENYILKFVVEKTKTVNLTASGGNTQLLNMS